MDFLGWYSTGEAPSEDDIHVHKQVSYGQNMTNLIYLYKFC